MTDAVPHPSEIPFPRLASHYLADPALWTVRPVRVLDGAVSYLNVKYAYPTGWRPLTLDLHVPVDTATPVPVVVYAHGGSFVGGIKEMGPWASLPRHGIAVVSVDYRLAGEVTAPEPVEDLLAAIRWTRVNAHRYGLDGDRVAGWGSSAGGYLMARAALTDVAGRPVGDHPDVPAQLSGLVLHYPVTDFTTVLDDAVEPTPESRRLVVDVVSRFFGVPMNQCPALLEEASLPRIAGSATTMPPVHLSHGDADHRVGPDQSRRLHEAILAAGGTSIMEIVPEADHAAAVFSEPSVVNPAIAMLRDAWSVRR